MTQKDKKIIQSKNYPKLTLNNISKTLNRWMNKQDKRDIEEESHFPITEALEFVFDNLKTLFTRNPNENLKFDEVMRMYIALFQCTGNNKHRYLVQNHIKELLRDDSYEKYRFSKKYYDFFVHVFDFYPYLVFRLLQSRYKIIFLTDIDEVIKLYGMYIKFATTRKNDKLIEQYIREEVNTEKESLDKLDILLLSYANTHTKTIQQNSLKDIIQIIIDYNNNPLKNNATRDNKMHRITETLLRIDWPPALDQFKSRIACTLIRKWESMPLTPRKKKTINAIISSINIDSHIEPQMEQAVKDKIAQHSPTDDTFALNCEFVKILLSKFTRQQSERIQPRAQYLKMVETIIANEFNRSQKIELLEVVRAKEIHQLSNDIEERLYDMIKHRLLNDKPTAPEQQQLQPNPLPAPDNPHMHNLIFALKTMRFYNFQRFDKLYNDFKKLILRDTKLLKQCTLDLKRQTLQVCLHYCSHNHFLSAQDERSAYRDIIELVGQQMQLKIMMIEYIVEHLNERFYNQTQIYTIYRQYKYDYLLYEDFATNDIIIKIFSIKTICYLAEQVQDQYRFFLKNAYNVIYDRLAIPDLLSAEQKKTALQLIREIIRHRGELFENQADGLALLLTGELHKSIEFHSPQVTSISGYILKIFQALMKKLPLKMVRYVPCLAHYTMSIVNFKIIKKQLKKMALQTFCELVQSCHYVLLPYFHFPNFYNIIREMLRSDDHYYFYNIQIMRLIGALGYIGQQQYMGLQLLNSENHNVNNNFQIIFRQTAFLKQYKQVENNNQVLQYKSMCIEDGFYTEEDIENNPIEIQNYVECILVSIVNNISPTIVEVKLLKSLKTIQNIIPVLTQPKDQTFLHNILFKKLLQIEEKYTNETLNIILELLHHHHVGTRCVEILEHYLKKIYNHKREDDLIRLLHLITQKYSELIDSQLINIIIVVKKIVIDSLDNNNQQIDKIRACLAIIMNLGTKIDRVLHLFFIDITQMLSLNNDKYEEKKINSPKEQISNKILSDYLTFVLFLTEHCPSISYYLPSIRLFIISYFHKEIQALQNRQKNNKKQHFKSEQEKRFIYKLIDTMISLMVRYGKRCESFIHILHANIKANHINHRLYNISEQYFKKHANLDYLHCAFTDNDLSLLNLTKITPLKIQAQQLPKMLTTNKNIIEQFESFCLLQNNTGEQQELWLDNLSSELLNSSGEPILKACSELAAYDKLFSFDIFEIPFYFFWKSLLNNSPPPTYNYDFTNLTPISNNHPPTEEVTKLTSKIKTILLRKDVSLKIRQKLIDCIYFIERCQIPFMIKDKVLSDAAIDIQDQVKALFYLQRQYENDPEVYRQNLIDKYAEIGEKQSAIGLFKSIKLSEVANKQNIIKLSQKLGPTVQFLEELNILRQKQKKMIDTSKKDKIQKFNFLQLQLKRDIYDWESINKLIEKENPKSAAAKKKFAHFAIQASINLCEWEVAKTWTPHLEQDKKNQEVRIWLTMLNIYEKKYSQAEKLIAQIREDMAVKIKQMFNLSYEKSMRGVLILQQVTELEEIVSFYRLSQIKVSQNKYSEMDAMLRKNKLIGLWNDRLEGLKNNLYSMQKILTIRNLLVNKFEDINNWIKFCKLAIKQNQKYLATITYKNLSKLEIKDEAKSLQLLLISQQIEILECVSSNEEAFNVIQQKILEKNLLQDKNSLPTIFQIYQKFSQRAIEEEKFTTEKGNKILKTLKAFPLLKQYYEISHYMGLVNIKLLQIIDQQDKKKTKHDKKTSICLPKQDDDIAKLRNQNNQDRSFIDKKQQYMLSALKCFIKSVTFNQRENKFFLEDCLKILNLISMGNHSAKLIDQLRTNYIHIPRQGLIEIIPQLIARLDNQSSTFKDLMKDIIIYIGKQHPQTLLFPLIYMKRGYKSETKKALAEQMIQKISENDHSKKQSIKSLFCQAQEIVQQICKISLKLSQKVYLFSRRILKLVEERKVTPTYLSTKIIQFCENILNQHQKWSSPSEFGFLQEQKSSLIALIQNLTLYQEFGLQFYFREAIGLIKQIKQKTNDTLSSIKKIYLEQASNKLFNVKKSEVILFGTYSPHIQNVTIDSFKNQIQIIPSKQRPKKIVIIGSDQKQYKYLIKGKEDLRLDQRIMQLFTFINKMFHSPSDKESYSIQGYSITPISYQIGIIAWVQKCDTMGQLIQNYRYNNGVRVDNGKIESRLCRHICPSYPNVEKYHKVQIYHQVIRQVSGMDLKNIFCKRSQTSQKWLKNRSCFIRSLAVMSIVGYIIGLGDRHPFNIMIQRDTWKIVHIDFGDCFQVNKMRKMFPEKVPFRLTRMLVNAMEACKTDGIFKHTCQKIMKILRMNKESILVIVEAFKYDPLFGWKLTTKGEKGDEVRLQHMEDEGIDGMISENDEEKKQANLFVQKQDLQSTKHILNIIKNKLIGKQNQKSQKGMSQAMQVDSLIKEAMSPLNLVQHFQNWCIFW